MEKTVAVIDGNSLMHRAYHAIQTPMMSLDGTPTNAIFGFLQMFCKFVEETSPDAVVCAFDTGKPVHRIAELPEYKAHRPHMDDELRVQFPVIEELLAAMNVPVIKVEGWEGDDILGTVAARNEKLGYKTLLVTGDKDACQLASELTSIVNTKKGISDVLILDPDGVMEKYGVTPSQFVDYLGLMGDSSDNIPGVAGIGPKSAQALIEKYGSIEGIYEHIDELKGKQKERLEESKDLAFLSRQIATIVRDLHFELDIEGLSFPSFDPTEVQNSFKKYSLVSPLTRVLSLANAKVEQAELEINVGKSYDKKTGISAVKKAIASSKPIGISFEYGAADTIFGANISCAFSVEDGYVVLEGDDAVELMSLALMSSASVFLDLKAAAQVVYPPDSSENTAISLDELYEIKAFDIGIAAYLLNSNTTSYGYDEIAQRYLGGPIPETDSLSEKLSYQAASLRMARPILEKKLHEDNAISVYENIDFPLIFVLVEMERIGVSLDFEKLSSLGEYSTNELEKLSSEIYDLAGETFNIDSPKQLGQILFDKMGLPVIKKNKGGSYSTDASVLRELAKTEKIANLVITYREFAKIKSTYIDSLPKMRAQDMRLHTSFHQTVTTTGRLSSSDPNLQNIPVRSEFGKRIRECFIPLDDKSVFMSADYSQIELRLLAHLSEDPGLISAFNDGVDFHTMTASRIFGVAPEEVSPQLRSKAKAVNFGIVYGQQSFGLAQALDISREEAKSIIDAYYQAYPQVRKYLDEVVENARRSGFAETMFGRKRYIPELRATNKQVQAVGERTAMNHPMQGSAADIIKMAMCSVQKRLNSEGFKSELLLQVHDELDLSVPEDEIDSVSTLLKEEMEGVCKCKVKLIAEVNWGPNWAKAH